MNQKSKICLALDGLTADEGIDMVSKMGRQVRAVKIHDLLDWNGPEYLDELHAIGVDPWVDYKLHDTRDTVGLRVRALVANGAKIITVHASGGVPMMQAAVNATFSGCDDPLAEIWAITVLTSLDKGEVARIYGKERTVAQIVREFALMAKEAGVETVVCSAEEVGVLSKDPELKGMKFTVPGTRSPGKALGQQKRSGTPSQAIADGATYLVAGSQVTKAEDPVMALEAMVTEISWIS